MSLTLEQQKTITQNDIDRLNRQRDLLQETVNKMGREVTDIYVKKQKASQELESVSLDILTREKKIADDTDILRSIERDIKRQELELSIKREKLNGDKEIFRQERTAYREKGEALEKERMDFLLKVESLDKREKGISDKDDELFVRNKQLSDLREDILKRENDMFIAFNDIAVKTDSLKEKEGAWGKEVQDAVDARKAAEFKLNEFENDIESMKENFNKDRESILESFRKRELDITRKEGEIHKLEINIKARLEQIEIKEGRKRMAENV